MKNEKDLNIRRLTNQYMARYIYTTLQIILGFSLVIWGLNLFSHVRQGIFNTPMFYISAIIFIISLVLLIFSKILRKIFDL